jgi:hypothetical protein
MNIRTAVGVWLASALALGCSVSYKYVQTTSQSAPSKPQGCDFDILTVRPDRKFVELGVFETTSIYCTKSVEVFRSKIRDEVCMQGGDAVLAALNGGGCYILGGVLKCEGDGASAAAR